MLKIIFFIILILIWMFFMFKNIYNYIFVNDNHENNYIKVYISSYTFINSISWGKLLNPELPIRFTDNKYDCNIILVVNGPDKNDIQFVNDNKNKTIITYMESYLKKDKDDDEKYLSVWSLDKAPNNFEWYFPKTYHEVKKDVPIESKMYGNIISVVLSSIYQLEGHKKRIDFIKFLEKEYSDKINLHIYGRDNEFNFKNYIGPLKDDDKSNALLPYKYHFNCENTLDVENYITEKFVDAILCENYIFYGGPKNIKNVYNDNCYSLLDMDDFEKSAQIIVKMIENNTWNEYLKSIRKLKKYILDTKTLSIRILNDIQK